MPKLASREDLPDEVAQELATLWSKLHMSATDKIIWKKMDEKQPQVASQMRSDPEKSPVISYMNVQKCSLEAAVYQLGELVSLVFEGHGQRMIAKHKL